MTDERKNEGLQVIGAGLMRTGTNSLQMALQRLLDGKCYHMYTVQQNLHHVHFWRSAAVKEPSDEEWRAFFADYKAAVDLPPACFYKQLMRVYPNAKVVLTVRDPEKWFHSVATTIAPSTKSVESFPMNILSKFTKFSKFLPMVNEVTALVLGPKFDYTDRERMLAAFHKHVEEVKHVVPEDRLLIFQATDGWEPLCRFLGAEVPQEPYPHVNTADDFLANVRRLKVMNTALVLISALVIGGLAYLACHNAEVMRWIPSTILQFGGNKDL